MIAHVLLANGDKELQVQLSLFLSIHLVAVDLASSATECLQQLSERRYHSLIVDTDLKWGGAEGVLTIVRQDSQLSKVPVIVTSATMTTGQLERFLVPPVVQVLVLENSSPFTALLQRILQVSRANDPNRLNAVDPISPAMGSANQNYPNRPNFNSN